MNLRSWQAKAVAKAFLIIAVAVCPAQLVTADGKVFSQANVVAETTIPDQRALIFHSSGVERLVIETRFSGEGTNFAWVVPLPNPPVIEEATTGLFSTLAYQLRPELVNDPLPLFAILGFCIPVGYLLLFVRKEKPLSVWDLVACVIASLSLLFVAPVASALVLLLLVWVVGRVRGEKEKPYAILAALALAFLLGGMALPALGPAGSVSAVSVTELASQRVGVFDTTTLTARDPSALLGWLRANEFAAPTNAAAVIADYISNGWVFVAAKVHREAASVSTNSIHPLSFTFRSDRPVYPLRLSGVSDGPLQVELYVFGTARAEAEHFTVKCCAPVVFPDAGSKHHSSSAEMAVMHPLLRQWTAGSSVVTKLVGNLKPSQMERDVSILWTSFASEQRSVYSRRGATVMAANWATGVASGLLLVTLILSALIRRWQRSLPRFMLASLIVGAVLLIVGYIALPKVAVQRFKRGPRFSQYNSLNLGRAFVSRWEASPPRSLAEARQAVPSESPSSRDNLLLGGEIREEDSPGNYLIRQTEDGFKFVWFDQDGGEHNLE